MNLNSRIVEYDMRKSTFGDFFQILAPYVRLEVPGIFEISV